MTDTTELRQQLGHLFESLDAAKRRYAPASPQRARADIRRVAAGELRRYLSDCDKCEIPPNVGDFLNWMTHL